MMPMMKWLSVAIVPSMSVQFSRESVMTPIAFVPAFSSNCAAAFSSTPVIKKPKAAHVMAKFFGSTPGHQHAPRIACDHSHRDSGGLQTIECLRRHQRVGLLQCLPSRLPVANRCNPALWLRVESQGELVAIIDECRGPAQIERERLIVHLDLIERRARVVRRLRRLQRRGEIGSGPCRAKRVVSRQCDLC